jgi:hypothetical protein
MAPSATAVQSKIKRPPGIQTSGINGIHSSTSSPSPSMSAGRLPPGAKYPTNGVTSNGVGNGSRSAKDRIRRDGPPQLLGRGQRNNSVGLRSASIVGESAAAAISEQPYSEFVRYPKERKLTSIKSNQTNTFSRSFEDIRLVSSFISIQPIFALINKRVVSHTRLL